MNTYEIRYVTENGFIGSVTIDAINSVMVWDQFNIIVKDFDNKVVSADWFLVEEN